MEDPFLQIQSQLILDNYINTRLVPYSINPDGTGNIVKDTNMVTIYHTHFTKKDQVKIQPNDHYMYLFILQMITVTIKAT